MSLRALLIEDDRASGEVRDALAGAGCSEPWIARTCDEAVALVRRDRLAPDVVVIDLAGRDPRVLAVLRRLRGVPVVAIADDAALGCPEALRADCVVRPIRRAELIARVHAALRLRAELARRAARERALAEEIRRLRRENEALERLVCVDSLTGIANRRHVLSLLQAEWKRSMRDQTPLAIVMLDLDYFHAFNERYGHPGGDGCLRRAAGAMVGCLRRPSDFLGRYGGEEFVAILSNTDAAGAQIVADRLRATVERLAIPHEGSPCAPVVTLSAGYAATQPAADRTADMLVQAADSALLRAKALGRNRAVGDAPHVVPARPPADAAWARCPTVVVDPWFADRIPQFLETARAEVHELEAARRARNFERVRAAARKLKVSARELGFDEIHRMACELDRAARTPDREAMQCTCTELAYYILHVQVNYRRRTVEFTAAVPA